MMDFLSLHPEAFGLDISDLSLKIIKLKKKRGVLSLASFGEAAIEPGIIKEGEIKDEEKLAEIIKEALKAVKGEKIKTKYIIASLPEEKAFLEVIQMPKMKEEELKKAVYFEAENYIPLPVTDVYLDSQIISSPKAETDQLEVLMVALPKKIVDSYASLFKKTGLIPKALEIESQAISRALVKDQHISASLLLVDFGATRTGITIFRDNCLRCTSSIPISSHFLTESLAKYLGVNFDQAEKLKLKYGIIKGKGEVKKVFETIMPILIDLKEQIQKHIDYYQSHTKNKNPIEKIILCGGGANLNGLTEFLSSELKLSVEIGNPWINIRPTPSELPLKESLKYTTAIGLALRDYD